jgi:hypothetical protein
MEMMLGMVARFDAQARFFEQKLQRDKERF